MARPGGSERQRTGTHRRIPRILARTAGRRRCRLLCRHNAACGRRGRLELRKDDTVLGTFSAGTSAPVVSISSPNGGTFNTGTIPVTWTANDTNGDAVAVTILYSADGGTDWTSVAFAHGSGTVQVPVASLASSINARFQVVASDGFNLGSAPRTASQSVTRRRDRSSASRPRRASSWKGSR